jgi:hypothetical protein
MDQIKCSSRKTGIQIALEIVLKNYFSKLKNNNRCSVARGDVAARYCRRGSVARGNVRAVVFCYARVHSTGTKHRS